MRQRGKTRGEHLRFTTYNGAGQEASIQAGKLAVAEKATVDSNDVHRRAHMLGMLEFRRCSVCKIGLPCQIHNEAAIEKALGIEPAELAPVVSAGEHQVLIDLYTELFKAARGVAPSFSNADFRRFKDLRQAHGPEKVRSMIEGAFRSTYWRNKVTIAKIAADPSMFLGIDGGAVAKSSGTLQREGVQP